MPGANSIEVGGACQGSDGVAVATGGGASDGRGDIGAPGEVRGGHDHVVGVEVEGFVFPGIEAMEVKSNAAAITTEGEVAPGILAIGFGTIGKDPQHVADAAIGCAVEADGRAGYCAGQLPAA